MCLVEKRVDGVTRQAWDREVRHVAERELVVPKICQDETIQYTYGNVLTPGSSSRPQSGHAYLVAHEREYHTSRITDGITFDVQAVREP